MNNEPVVSLVVGLITAGAAVLVAFGVHVTPEQIAALCGFAAAALGVGFYVRSKVTPTRKLPGGEAGLTLVEVLVVLLIVLVVLILVGAVR
jgi:hypothetical protein